MDQSAWVYVLAASSAAVLSILLIIICIFCYKRYSKSKKIPQLDEMIIYEKTPFSPLYKTPVARQSGLSQDDSGLTTSYTTDKKKIWYKFSPSASCGDLITSHKDGTFVWEDFSDCSNEETDFGSNESILDSTDDIPTINFTLFWNESNKILSVKVLNITHLPKKYGANCSSYVKVILLGNKKETQKSNVRKKSGINPLYRETFEFSGYTLEDMKQFSLKLSVYVKEFKNLRNKFIGDAIYFLGNSDFRKNKQIVCSENLLSKKEKKIEKFSPSKMSSSQQQLEAGHLFVLLQYQAIANRLKVLIRKAEHLTRAGRLHRDHYIIINLMKDKEKLMSKETKAHGGSNPVWNEPFLFDVDSSQSDDYWLQLLLMKGHFYSKKDIVGHVLIGPGTTPRGISHWNAVFNQCTSPGEIAKWHTIYFNCYQ